MNDQERKFVALCAFGIDSITSAILSGCVQQEVAAIASSLLERDDIQDGINTQRERYRREYERAFTEMDEAAERLLSEPIEF